MSKKLENLVGTKIEINHPETNTKEQAEIIGLYTKFGIIEGVRVEFSDGSIMRAELGFLEIYLSPLLISLR